MATADDDKDEKGAIVRSPKYPSISLSDAVAKVRLIYAKDKTSGSPVEAAVRHMGYKSRSGPANTTVAALRRYGLVESTNGRLVPTTRAVSIMVLPENDDRRKAALREAVLAPLLYKRLFDQYQPQGHIPSNESIEQELLIDGAFNHNSVKALVKDFVSSLIFAGLSDENGVIFGCEPARDAEDGEQDDENGGEETPSSPSKLHRKPKKMTVGIKEDVFSLDEGPVVIQWPERISKESAADLGDWLELIGRKIKRASESPVPHISDQHEQFLRVGKSE